MPLEVGILARAATTIFAGVLAWALCAAPAAAGAALLFDTETATSSTPRTRIRRGIPASLTKMMTAYLAFEAIRDHKATEDTKVFISQNARKQPPTRLGLEGRHRPDAGRRAQGPHHALGQRHRGGDRRGAGGGDEMSFVKQMNQKAAELGMLHTHFINPNGLPAEQQVTTARDMALLAQALLRDFPERAPLYAETQAQIGKITIGTHNAILTNFPGGDGIKTGFTCASGYNLAASATRDGHKLVAILLGEETSAKRTARAAALLEHGFRTREWKELYPTPRVENLPSEVVGAGFEPDATLLERFRVCAAPPPPPKDTASTARSAPKRRTAKKKVRSRSASGARAELSGVASRPCPTFASIASQMSAAMSAPAEVLHLADARRRGDVDLGQVGPITSMPAKSSPRFFSSGPRRAQISSSRAVSLVGCAVPPTCRLERVSPFCGSAVDGARHLAVDEDDALVAVSDLGPVLLHHERLAEHGLEQLHQRGGVGVVGRDAEDGGAAVAVERLQDDVLASPRGTPARRRASA